LLSISERVELENIIRDLDRIYNICNEIVNKNPLQLSEEIALASAIRDTAERIRGELKASIDQYNALQSGPFQNQQNLFSLQTFIYKLILSDYKSQVLPNFQKLTEKIIEKGKDLVDKAEEHRKAGKNIPEKSELEKELTEAKSEIESARDDSTTGANFNNISSFAARAKPYVEKIVKGAKIALGIMALFV
jgi:hypothetical protein